MEPDVWDHAYWVVDTSVLCVVNSCMMAALVAFSRRRVFGRWSRNRRFIKVRVKLADTRRSNIVLVPDARLQAVGLQVLWIVNPAVGWHRFLPGLWLPSQPLGVAGLYLRQTEQLLKFSTCRVIYLLTCIVSVVSSLTSGKFFVFNPVWMAGKLAMLPVLFTLSSFPSVCRFCQ